MSTAGALGTERKTVRTCPLFAYPDMPTESEILSKHERLIRHMARPFTSFGPMIDDLLQEGRLALLVAARKYDPAYGAELWTYARKYVLGAILKLVNNELSRIDHEQFDESEGRDGYDFKTDRPTRSPASEAALAANQITPEDGLMTREVLADAAKGISLRNLSIVEKYDVEEKDFQTIAIEVGLARTQTQDLYKRTIEMLRQRAA